MKGRQSRYLQNGLEMAELTGGGASGTGGDTATGIWYRNRYWTLPELVTFLLSDGGSTYGTCGVHVDGRDVLFMCMYLVSHVNLSLASLVATVVEKLPCSL
jgi:hypothetical protein